jgi:tRNA(adenine34) deaminase
MEPWDGTAGPGEEFAIACGRKRDVDAGWAPEDCTVSKRESGDFTEGGPFVSDEVFMEMALELARAAAAADEAPVGAVIVRGGQVLAAARNEREVLRDPTAHAEMIAITQAAAALGSWRLEQCTLYVTLEPCCMCSGAIVQARVPRVVYGAVDPKAGAARSLFRLLDDPRLNHRCELVEGVLAEPCGRVLTEFFQGKRRGAK